MGKVCLKCGYERKEEDDAPSYACPRCSAVYAKVEAHLRRQEDEVNKHQSGNTDLALGKPHYHVHAWFLLAYVAITVFWIIREHSALGALFFVVFAAQLTYLGYEIWKNDRKLRATRSVKEENAHTISSTNPFLVPFRWKGELSVGIFWGTLALWFFLFILLASQIQKPEVWQWQHSAYLAGFSALFLLAFFQILIKRLRGVGLSLWFALLGAIPYVGLLWLIYLGFVVDKERPDQTFTFFEKIRKQHLANALTLVFVVGLSVSYYWGNPNVSVDGGSLKEQLLDNDFVLDRPSNDSEIWQGITTSEITDGIRGALRQHDTKFRMICTNPAYLRCLEISETQCIKEVAQYHESCLSRSTFLAFSNLDYYILTPSGGMQLGSNYAQCHIDSHVASKPDPDEKRACVTVLSLFR